jgi:hypothetical protein
MKKIIFLLIAAGIFCGSFNLRAGDKTSKTSGESGDPHDYHKRSNNYRDQKDEEYGHYSGARNFRGHWAGIEFGFNNYNYLSSNTLPDDISYMTPSTTNSNCFNINFSQVNIGFSRHMGIVSGIGLNWNNYRFENNNSIEPGPDGYITNVILNGASPVKKSKFSTLYLNVPVLLELQIPAGFSHHLNLAAGVIGGIKINAWTKIVYENDEKSRVNGDYNLNLLRGGVTARVGYENFTIYGTYYLTPWFQDFKGPNGLNLEPFEIGIAFTFND